MESGSFRLPVPDEGRDDVELHVARWAPTHADPRAVVQIAHGMAEHSGRYARTAEALTDAGYLVYASDHRGHGQTARMPGDLGYFADSGGWQRLVDDLYGVRRHVGGQHPGLPYIMLGHSMGSFVVQDYLFTHGDSIDAAVLSGTTRGQRALAGLGIASCRVERMRLGPRGRSAIIKALSTGSYNARISKPRTEFDWLSRDEAEVDRYVADPLCGFDFTVQAWSDLFTGLMRIGNDANIKRVPPGLPIYLFSGSECPVGRYGKDPVLLAEAYERAGVQDVTRRVYDGGRHEMLNEINRDEVCRDLVAWLDRTLERRQHAA